MSNPAATDHPVSADHPVPADPKPVHQTPDPAPEQPAPEQPAPEQPAPEQPAPEQPKPELPEPEQPKPAEAKAKEPEPEQQKLADPAPKSEPLIPSQPNPAAPAPPLIIDTPSVPAKSTPLAVPDPAINAAQATQPSIPPAKHSPKQTEMNVGMYVGIGIGIFAILLCIGGIFWIRHRKRKDRLLDFHTKLSTTPLPLQNSKHNSLFNSLPKTAIHQNNQNYTYSHQTIYPQSSYPHPSTLQPGSYQQPQYIQYFTPAQAQPAIDDQDTIQEYYPSPPPKPPKKKIDETSFHSKHDPTGYYDVNPHPSLGTPGNLASLSNEENRLGKVDDDVKKTKSTKRDGYFAQDDIPYNDYFEK